MQQTPAEEKMTAISVASIDSLITLLDCMEQTPRLSDDEVKALYEPYSDSLFERMIASGERLGEVRGGTLSFLTEVDDRSEVIARDQDFDWQLGVVSGTFSEFLQTGEVPPPHYPMRVAILLRKAGLRALERRFLQGWERHFGGRGNGATYGKLSERLAKMTEKYGANLALIAAAFLIAAVLPASAAWKVTSKVDRMTDRAEKTASVTAKAPDHGVSATLYVYCLGFKGDTSPIVNIQTTARFTPGRMGLRYRLDNDEAEPRFMPVDSSGRGMSLWAEPITFFGKKRLRVEMQPARSSNLFFEFNIRGAEQVIRGLGCKKLSMMD